MEQSVAVRSELTRLRVFISFSKPKSKILAEALHEWLPRVLQSVDPLISESIDKGSAWPEGLDQMLNSAAVGIFCLTSENLGQPWIHFEAGALYMKLGPQRVCPYLLDVDYSEVPWPLARFQPAKTTKAETRKLLTTINEALGEGRLKEQVLDETFEVWWSRLEKSIKAAQELQAQSKPTKRGSEDILEELVNLARSQSRQIESLEDIVSQVVAASQFGGFPFGATTPADAQHMALAGRSPYAKLRPYIFTTTAKGTETNPPTDVTPGTPLPGTRSESS